MSLDQQPRTVTLKMMKQNKKSEERQHTVALLNTFVRGKIIPRSHHVYGPRVGQSVIRCS